MKVCIIGGGIIGSSIALFLRQLSQGRCTVEVLEPDPRYARASSALSAGSIRQQFSTPLNIAMSQFGLQYIQHPEHLLAIEPSTQTSETSDVGYVECGYLYLATAEGAPVLRANHRVQREQNAPIALLEPPALNKQFPWLQCDDLALGSLGLNGEGWFDGYSLLRAVRNKAVSEGAHFMAQAVVDLAAGPPLSGNRPKCVITALTASGNRIEADYFINAAGPWARAVAAMLGIALPVHARRRTVFALECATSLPFTPLVIDPCGLWFRSDFRAGQGNHFLAGWSPMEGEPDPDDLPLDPELQAFEAHLWEKLAHRVPAFEALRVRSAWAGYYEFNPIDHNAIIGAHPQWTNFIFANGFSGHGLQHALATGRGIAELLVHGAYQSLDLTALRFERFEQGETFRERCVI